MIVDSGADRSMLPRDALKTLGLRGSAEVGKDAGQSQGVRSRFVTWFSRVPLTGQIAIPQPSGAPMLWGPVFPLSVRFATKAPALAGRADFFQHFEITFIEDSPNDSVMQITI